MIYNSMEEMIGETPLLRLHRLEKALSIHGHLYAKLEYKNPAGSAKDRAAYAMILSLEKTGALLPGGNLIEPTSGNTGIALAALAAARGYRMTVVMPDTMSRERILLMKAYGAEVVLTDGKEGMAGAIREAERLAATRENAVIPAQFDNLENPAAHARTTGPEILRDLKDGIDFFVAGVGTGGTLSGAGSFLKKHLPSLSVVAVEPAASPLVSKGIAGTHKIQGIGANFLPRTLDTTVIDAILTVTDADAYRTGALLGRIEGVLTGISGGAALHAATTLLKKEENYNKTAVVVLPDGGDHYLSVPGYYDQDQ